MSCYIIIDATDPNIAAIRGLAPGPVGLARLDFTLAQHDVFAAGHLPCSTPLSVVITANWCVQTDSRDNILAAHCIAQTDCILSNHQRSACLWLDIVILAEAGGQFTIAACGLASLREVSYISTICGINSYLYKWFTKCVQ